MAAAGAGGPAAPAGQGGPAGHAGTGPLAARPALARSVIEGHAVFYDPGQASGSCGLGPFPAGGWYASLPPRGYASGRACGSYLDVYGPGGTVRAEVVDVCTGCAAGTVNLSRAAFARIASPRRGTVAVSYQAAVNPPLPGPLTLRITAAGGPARWPCRSSTTGTGCRRSRPAGRAAGGSASSRAPTDTGPGRFTGTARDRAGRGGTAAALAGGGTGPAPAAVSASGSPMWRATGAAHRDIPAQHRAARLRLDVPGRRQQAGRDTRPPAAPRRRRSRAGTAASAGSC